MPSEDEEPFRSAGELCAQGRFVEALELLQPLVDREPHNHEAWSLLAWAELGAEHDDRALDAAEHAIGLNPAACFPEQLAAAALLRLRRPGEAVAHARRAVQIDPFDWRALGTLARALTRAGSDADEAQELTTRMVALAPEEPEAHLIAGSVAAAAGNREEAKRSFRRVLQLDPASGAAQHELARLRLKHRVNDPAALAEATDGFARAAQAEPDKQQSVHSMEAMLRLFLAKTAYLLLIDAFLVGRLAATSSTLAARVLAPALLLIPAFYAWRFVDRLTPPLRSRLYTVLTRQWALRTAASLEAISVLAILAAAILAESARPRRGHSRGDRSPWAHRPAHAA